MMISSILVQSTNWRNVDKALIKLKPFLTPEQIDEMPIDVLAQLIRSSGFYNIKAKRIKAFMEWFKTYDYNIEQIKDIESKQLHYELLAINGIEKETADVMLLYAFDKPTTYDGFQNEVEEKIPRNLNVYNEYHALLAEHARHIANPIQNVRIVPKILSVIRRVS